MRTVWGPIYILRPYERGIQETLGKYNRFVMPGFGFQVPIVHISHVRDIHEQTVNIDPHPVISKDIVEIALLDDVIWMRPTAEEGEIERAFCESIENWQRAIIQLATTNLHQEFGELSLDDETIHIINRIADQCFAADMSPIKQFVLVECAWQDNTSIAIPVYDINTTLLPGTVFSPSYEKHIKHKVRIFRIESE